MSKLAKKQNFFFLTGKIQFLPALLCVAVFCLLSALCYATVHQEMPNENVSFQLNKIELQGNSVFSYPELEKLFSDKFGQKVSFAELEQITKSITRKYRNAGYLLSRATLQTQTITNGIVRIQIFEGYISAFSIKTNAKSQNKLLEAYASRIMQNRPLQLKTLESYTLMANTYPEQPSMLCYLLPKKNREPLI